MAMCTLPPAELPGWVYWYRCVAGPVPYSREVLYIATSHEAARALPAPAKSLTRPLLSFPALPVPFSDPQTSMLGGPSQLRIVGGTVGVGFPVTWGLARCREAPSQYLPGTSPGHPRPSKLLVEQPSAFLVQYSDTARNSLSSTCSWSSIPILLGTFLPEHSWSSIPILLGLSGLGGSPVLDHQACSPFTGAWLSAATPLQL